MLRHMNPSQVYIAVAVVILGVVFVVVFLLGRAEGQNRLTTLGGLAFGFVIAGIAFGNGGLLGYGLMAIGVVLAFVDQARRRLDRN